MKFFIPLLFAVFSLGVLNAQNSRNFWQEIPESQMRLAPDAQRDLTPLKYRTFTLELEDLKQYLASAPMEGTPAANSSNLELLFPLPDGSFMNFVIWESPAMHPELAKKHPDIKSFAGRNKKSGASISFDYGGLGFHGSIRTEKNTFYIDPFAKNQQRYYQVYDVRDDVTDMPALSCGHTVDPVQHNEELLKNLKNDYPQLAARTTEDQVELRTYILAMTNTGEYAENYYGSSKDLVLASFVTAINRLNQTYQRDIAVKFLLHPEEDKLIFTNSTFDPFPAPIVQLGRTIVDTGTDVINRFINPDSYDIGHIFTINCTDGVAGVASGALCGSNKGNGVTCHWGGNVINAVVNTMTHEVGHQFSAGHTWDNCNLTNQQVAGQRSLGYEPGSGTTIMSYAGACLGINNVQGNNDDYFHSGSLEQMYRHSRVGTGNVCPDIDLPGNHYPVIDFPYQSGFYIPNGTPFELEAKATDPDGDVLTYNWDQQDHAISPVTMGQPEGNCAIYRSYPPSVNAFKRTFPKLDILLGDSDPLPYEILADYARDFTFRFVVRDNGAVAGGVVWDEVRFKTDDNAEPFALTYPDQNTTAIKAGEQVEIAWNLADSDKSPVNCKSVNIKLSLDGGYTYPITLASNTPNDGAEKIFMPNQLTNRARVRVEAADNIFFNISRKNFSITAPETPGYAVSITPTYYYACLPTALDVDISTASFLNFSETINIEIASTLPSGVTATLSKNQVQPSESATLSLMLENGLGSGSLVVPLIIYTDGGDTLHREIVLDLVSNDFSAIELIEPANGATGLNEVPTFKWMGAADAEFYQFQLATNPAFLSGQIVYQSNNVTTTSYTNISVLLDENKAYYWRVRPVNRCGAGEWLPLYAFHTLSKTCKRRTGLEGDLRRPIPGSGNPAIEDQITILENGVINDLNIPNIKGSYDNTMGMKLTLIGPDGTPCLLYANSCNGLVFNFGFDDAVPLLSPCPPADGRLRLPRDTGRLAKYNDKDINGTWTLRLETSSSSGSGGGGSLEEWSIEYCANLTPSSPFFVKNDTLRVPPGQANPVTRTYLEVQDNTSLPEKIEFTLVTLPKNGRLFLVDQELKVGDVFRQSTVNAGNLVYEHDGSSTLADDFTFTISNEEGGWLATPQFNIVIDPDASVGVTDPKWAAEINVFPNPATNELNVDLGFSVNEPVVLSLSNMQGQEMISEKMAAGTRQMQINTSGLASGVYFLSFRTALGKITKKVMINR